MCSNEHKVNDVTDKEESGSTQFDESNGGVSKVEPIDTKNPEEERQRYSDIIVVTLTSPLREKRNKCIKSHEYLKEK